MSSQVYTQGSGTASTDLFVTVLSPVDPSPSINYPPGKRWVNTTTKTEWITTSPGVWIELGGGTSVAEKLQGNSGGQVGPTNNTIFVEGDGDTINIIGNPSTSTLTASIVSPLNVINGGTGDISFVPNSIVCGGTSAQGALQSLPNVGSTGNVLISQGSAGLPVWGTLPGTSITTRTKTYTAAGTYSYTPSANCFLIYVQAIGGGGSGGGAGSGSTDLTFGSGGAAGAYIDNYISTIAPQTITVGAGGAVSGGTGNAGSKSMFGTLVTANGGAGGSTATMSSSFYTIQGGLGQSANYSELSSFAQNGGTAFAFLSADKTQNSISSGAGGSTVYGSGGNSVVTNELSIVLSGLDGRGPGAGGSGAISSYGTGGIANSGAGADGAVIVVEFIN